MRSAIWLFLIFVAAVAAALFLGENRATVTLFWHPYRVDMSLNLVLLVLGSLFALLVLAMRTFASLRKVQQQTGLWRHQQRERGMHQALLTAFEQFIEGNHEKSLLLAEQAIGRAQKMQAVLDQAPQSKDHSAHHLVEAVLRNAHWLASESAHALNDIAKSDAHYHQYELLTTPRTQHG